MEKLNRAVVKLNGVVVRLNGVVINDVTLIKFVATCVKYTVSFTVLVPRGSYVPENFGLDVKFDAEHFCKSNYGSKIALKEVIRQ
jgi:hypothetical protein